ncbi:MAG: ABC transporter substrate-binding protein [Gammaproteobacteria bacterium]
MHIKKMLQIFLVTMFGWMIFNSANAAPQGDPVALLQYIANNMINQLKANSANLKTKPQIVYSLAYKYVVPYADLGEMSKRVIPPSVWNSSSGGQHQQFEKQFTRLLIRTYASALTSYRDQSVEFYPVRGGTGSGNVEVNSRIISPDASPISVTYRLIRKGSGWKIYDMSVEGVSLIDSFRSQFSDILAQGNMDTLLQRMSSHSGG